MVITGLLEGLILKIIPLHSVNYNYLTKNKRILPAPGDLMVVLGVTPPPGEVLKGLRRWLDEWFGWKVINFVTFSAPFHFPSRLSPKRPFTCQHELILSC